MKKLPVLLRTAAALTAAVCMSGCFGPRTLAERAVYREAYRAVKARQDLPLGATLAPRRRASVYVAKNAARVDLPYQLTNAAGQTETGYYTVWLKRIARRWELDRAYQGPLHEHLAAQAGERQQELPGGPAE